MESNHVFVIAEAGVNHNGDIEIAKKMIAIAKSCGVDAIKFQTFKSEKLVSKFANKADYQISNTKNNDSQLEMVKKLELSYSEFYNLKKYCDELDIIFMSTPFDFESINFLNELEMDTYKIPSGEITNLPYLRKIAKLNKSIIMSTGMSTLDEIEQAITILKDNGTEDITLLHCTTEYPAPIDEINLKAMCSLKEKFELNIGYSDHTTGIEVPIAAVAMGAKVIEKHFTLDKTMEGPDHKASLEPDELSAMVKAIRKIELALGDGVKKPSKSEVKNINIARKSIVANCPIKKGEAFTENNITVKRPGNGISPMKWDIVLGQLAKRDFVEDELIEI
jgi:N,N'-diacetyllegionaminate synthase